MKLLVHTKRWKNKRAKINLHTFRKPFISNPIYHNCFLHLVQPPHTKKGKINGASLSVRGLLWLVMRPLLLTGLFMSWNDQIKAIYGTAFLPPSFDGSCHCSLSGRHAVATSSPVCCSGFPGGRLKASLPLLTRCWPTLPRLIHTICGVSGHINPKHNRRRAPDLPYWHSPAGSLSLSASAGLLPPLHLKRAPVFFFSPYMCMPLWMFKFLTAGEGFMSLNVPDLFIRLHDAPRLSLWTEN